MAKLLITFIMLIGVSSIAQAQSQTDLSSYGNDVRVEWGRESFTDENLEQDEVLKLADQIFADDVAPKKPAKDSRTTTRGTR